MTLVRYNRPVLGNYVPRSFNNLIDEFFQNNESDGNINTYSAKVDVLERDKQYDVMVAAPGLQKDDFEIELKERTLTISGERKREEEQEGLQYHTAESHYGSFSRSFKLPANIVAAKIEAKYEAGVLTVVIPKDEKKALKTTIKVK